MIHSYNGVLYRGANDCRKQTIPTAFVILTHRTVNRKQDKKTKCSIILFIQFVKKKKKTKLPSLSMHDLEMKPQRKTGKCDHHKSGQRLPLVGR